MARLRWLGVVDREPLLAGVRPRRAMSAARSADALEAESGLAL